VPINYFLFKKLFYHAAKAKVKEGIPVTTEFQTSFISMGGLALGTFQQNGLDKLLGQVQALYSISIPNKPISFHSQQKILR
jgi:hypothetical protein